MDEWIVGWFADLPQVYFFVPPTIHDSTSSLFFYIYTNTISNHMNEKVIGIMGAMPEEINGVVQLLTDVQEFSRGMRTYFTGELNGIKTVVVFSRWGKVPAATTVTNLIVEFNCTELIFTGVAGAINEQLKIGDLVIAKRLIQHDMDARPLMPQFEIPLLNKTYFKCSESQLYVGEKAVNELLATQQLYHAIEKEELIAFGITAPKLWIGDITSGDKFFANAFDKNELLKNLPNILCVEMEGAAVAQVCYEYKIPFTIIRTISDTADENSHIDFPSFIKNISSKYSVEVVKNIFKQF